MTHDYPEGDVWFSVVSKRGGVYLAPRSHVTGLHRELLADKLRACFAPIDPSDPLHGSNFVAFTTVNPALFARLCRAQDLQIIARALLAHPDECKCHDDDRERAFPRFAYSSRGLPDALSNGAFAMENEVAAAIDQEIAARLAAFCAKDEP